MAGKNKIFRTADFGYYIPDVDETIQRYNAAIKKLQGIVSEQNDIINKKEREIEKGLQEIRRLHLEMSLLEVPDMATAQEYLVLNTFKNRKGENPEQQNIDIEKEQETYNEGNVNKKALLESIEEELNISQSSKSEEFDMSESLENLKKNLNINLNKKDKEKHEDDDDDDDDDDDVFKIIV